MTDNPQRKIYHHRNYTPKQRPRNPARDLIADILFQAGQDVLSHERLQELRARDSRKSQAALSLHRRAKFYFSGNHHVRFSEALGLDPDVVRQKGMAGEIRYTFHGKETK